MLVPAVSLSKVTTVARDPPGPVKAMRCLRLAGCSSQQPFCDGVSDKRRQQHGDQPVAAGLKAKQDAWWSSPLSHNCRVIQPNRITTPMTSSKVLTSVTVKTPPLKTSDKARPQRR